MSPRADPERVVPGLHPVRELLRAGVTVRAIHLDRDRDTSDVLAEILERASSAGIRVIDEPRDRIDAIAGVTTHQGIVATGPPYRYADVEDLLERVPDDEPALLVALDGVTDPHNLGSVARTAEAVGAHGLVVPERRAAGVTPAAEKAAAGALAHLPVARVTNLTRTIKGLGERHVWSVALDADGDVDVRACGLLTEPVVIVVGAEGRGVSRLVGETCDQRISLRMRGRVGSLNASVAAAVTLYAAWWARTEGQARHDR